MEFYHVKCVYLQCVSNYVHLPPLISVLGDQTAPDTGRSSVQLPSVGNGMLLKKRTRGRENRFDKVGPQEWMDGEDGTAGARLPTRSASSYLLANIRLPQKMLRPAKAVGVSCMSRACIWGL